MNIDDNQVAHVTVKEFHDLLGAFSEQHDSKEDEDVIVVEYNVLPDTDLQPEQFKQIQKIAKKLDLLVSQIRLLDGEFHDIVDGQYC